ncbi:MAG: PKD domain-containing protein [Candidatus Helarchaeota archaeon]
MYVPLVQAIDPPIHIHLTWQNATNTTITITWQTSNSNSGDWVLFDTIPRGGVPSAYSFNQSGNNFTYTGASGVIHVVELSGLTPNTIYYFICGGPVGGYSKERAVRTSPTTSTHVRFIVGGDSRSQPTEREKISRAMAQFNPDFIMHSGDMVADGRIQSQWDLWFTDLHTNWIGTNNLTIPIIPAIGNHEYNSINYYSQFALPGNEMWFSYDWGPDIHITVLSTETATDGAQKTWLENDLATHANYKWKFVIFHQPPFSATRTSGNAGALSNWVPLFDKYHVDIVFNGHDHAYLRTKPLNWTASQTEPQPYSNATMYVVTGGWGAPLYSLISHWYDAYGIERYHFCLIDIFPNGTLHLQAKDNQGLTFDEAWLIKNDSLAIPMSINLTAPTKQFHNTLPINVTWNTTGIIDHYNIYLNGQYQTYQAYVEKSYQITTLAEGNHTIDVVAYDPRGDSQNATFKLSYDVTPPITSDDYDGGWYSSSFRINLTALDNVSGVATTYYSINDGMIQEVESAGQPNITEEGSNNKLEYWSVDRAGNEELPHNLLTDIKLDLSPPLANGGGNQTTEIGAVFTFNGSASVDVGGIVNYTWTFIDDGIKILTGITPTYVFNTTGVHQVTLNVTDHVGRWNTDIFWVNVIDSSPPIVNFTAVQSAFVGSTIFFNASQSTDNSGIIQYIWDFGDNMHLSSGIPFVTHVYHTPGTYIIRLTVIDKANNSAVTTLTIQIEGFNLQIPWWLVNVTIIETVLFSLLVIWDLKKNSRKLQR